MVVISEDGDDRDGEARAGIREDARLLGQAVRRGRRRAGRDRPPGRWRRTRATGARAAPRSRARRPRPRCEWSAHPRRVPARQVLRTLETGYMPRGMPSAPPENLHSLLATMKRAGAVAARARRRPHPRWRTRDLGPRRSAHRPRRRLPPARGGRGPRTRSAHDAGFRTSARLSTGCTRRGRERTSWISSSIPRRPDRRRALRASHRDGGQRAPHARRVDRRRSSRSCSRSTSRSPTSARCSRSPALSASR